MAGGRKRKKPPAKSAIDRNAKFRELQSSDEKNDEKQKDRMQHQVSRANQSPDKKNDEKQKDRMQHRVSRANQSPDEKNDEKQKDMMQHRNIKKCGYKKHCFKNEDTQINSWRSIKL